MTYWPQSTAEEILYKPDREYLLLTLVPIPSSATVTLTAPGYTQITGKNQIKVLKGTVVHYKLQAATYSDVEGNITVNYSQVVTVDMNNYQYDTFTIVPNPSDATVTLTASGATQSGNSITVKRGTTINYEVERTGYNTVTGTKVTTQPSESLTVTMQVKTYSFTIDPNPSDATVTLVSSGGQTQVGKTITVNYNDNVTWTVSKTGYVTRTSVVTVTEDQVLGVDLTLEDYIITVNPTPSSATVVLTSSGGQTQVGKTITVNYNDVVSYTVSATNYQTKTGSLTVTAAQILNINLELVNRTLTISPTPSNATVVLTASGYTQSGNSITVPHGTSVNYSVSKDYYVTASGIKVVNATETMAVTLTELPKYTVTFNPIDSETGTAVENPTYNLSSAEGTSSTSSITVHQGTVVTYNISADDYMDASGSYTVTSTATVNISMEEQKYFTYYGWQNNDVTYYAWIGNGTTYYTISSTPNIGDIVYDSNFGNTGMQVTAYSAESGITVGNLNKYVAVAQDSPTGAYSTDGINWTSTTLPSSQTWSSVTYGNGKFVAVAYNSATGAYSTDGTTWTEMTLPNSAYWMSVTYGNGKFVAVGYLAATSYGAYSTDGITWTSMTLPASKSWQSVTYGNGKFVAVAYGPSTASSTGAYSTDGITWTETTLPSPLHWRSVTYGNGKFVAVRGESNTGAYSTDGITWTSMTLPASQNWYSVTYGNGKFVAVAPDTSIAAYSTDGITWTSCTLPSSQSWLSITFGNEKFVTISPASSTGAYSTDGINWTSCTLTGYQPWRIITYGKFPSKHLFTISPTPSDATVTLTATGYTQHGNSIEVPAGTEVSYSVSKDGYVTQTNTVTVSSPQTISVELEEKPNFVAVAFNSSTGAYSTDGITWTSMNMPSSNYWKSVTYGNGKFVAIADSSSTGAYSEDGITWTSMNMPSSNYWKSVTYGNGKFVAIADSSSTGAYSTDGINWTEITLASSSIKISFCNGYFFLLSGKDESLRIEPTLYYSTDLTNWNSVTMESSPSRHTYVGESICYSPDVSKYILTTTLQISTSGNCQSRIYTSSDLSTWSFSTTMSDYVTIDAYAYIASQAVFGNSIFIATSGQYTKLSPDGSSWTSTGKTGVISLTSQLIYGCNKFLLIGVNSEDSNSCEYSADGTNWTSTTLPISQYWTSVCARTD